MSCVAATARRLNALSPTRRPNCNTIRAKQAPAVLAGRDSSALERGRARSPCGRRRRWRVRAGHCARRRITPALRRDRGWRVSKPGPDLSAARPCAGPSAVAERFQDRVDELKKKEKLKGPEGLKSLGHSSASSSECAHVCMQIGHDLARSAPTGPREAATLEADQGEARGAEGWTSPDREAQDRRERGRKSAAMEEASARSGRANKA